MICALIVSLTNFGAIDVTRGIMEITETILSMVNAASEPGQSEALTKKDDLEKRTDRKRNPVYLYVAVSVIVIQ